MEINQTAFGRQARSVCIVSDLPVRLQEKKAKREKLSDARIVRIGSIKVLIGVSATGEITFEIEPP